MMMSVAFPFTDLTSDNLQGFLHKFELPGVNSSPENDLSGKPS